MNQFLYLYKQIIIDIVTKHLPTASIYLFGSRSQNKNRQGADIDIAIDAHSPIPYEVLLKIKADIDESDIPVFVDIIDVHAISQEFKNAINPSMIIWKK